MIAHGGGIPPSKPANSPYASRGALTVDVAAQFAAWTARNRRAAAAHRWTRVDHALPFGCEVCTRGAESPDLPGWEIHYERLFCARCVNLATAKRIIARLAEAAQAAS